MLLEEVPPARAPTGSKWTVEVKYDGYRLVVAIDGAQRVMLRTKNGADATRWYPELQSMKALPPWTVLDGEACILDERGHADFVKCWRRRGNEPTRRRVFEPA